jgi:mannose-6-phosphate isomerase class I
MQPKKARWSKVYESSEEELVEFLGSRKIAAQRLTLAEFETATLPAEATPPTLWCAEGSMTVRGAGAKVSMQPGDSVQLPANSELELFAGISGCVYYESSN